MSFGDVCRHCGCYRESHIRSQQEHFDVRERVRVCPGFEVWNSLTEQVPPFRRRKKCPGFYVLVDGEEKRVREADHTPECQCQGTGYIV